MIKYCKAYPAERFKAFAGWFANTKEPIREKVKDQELDGAPENDASSLYFYLHDTYVVTQDVSARENIVFDEVTPEWIKFCHDTLQFEPPTYVSTKRFEGSREAEDQNT